MGKTQLGPQTLVYPQTVVLVGAKVDGKPNFLTIAAQGVPNITPPMLSIAVRPHRYTLKGIMQEMAFSVNVPSVDLIKETDYCGTISGARVNKAEVCRFDLFYGKLGGVPLIQQCPVNLECRVLHTLNLGSHIFIIGQVEEVHVSDGCLTEGRLDANKIRAFCYTGATSREYQPIGPVMAKGHSIGLELRGK